MDANTLKSLSVVFMKAATNLREMGKQASHGDTRSLAAFCESMSIACKERQVELLSGKP
jgi:hypothetical protein